MAMEFLAHGQQPLAITVFAKENAETKKRNEALQSTKEASRRGEIEQDLSSLTSSRKPFTWEELKVR
jgi:ATP-binding cassette subfamily G (WHITE) protein 2 (SNQ2)